MTNLFLLGPFVEYTALRDNAVFKHLKAPSGSTQHRRYTRQSVFDDVHLVAMYLDMGHVLA